MADEAAKRREARRRRIIVNSEDRMRRLLCRGKDNNLECKCKSYIIAHVSEMTMSVSNVTVFV